MFWEWGQASTSEFWGDTKASDHEWAPLVLAVVHWERWSQPEGDGTVPSRLIMVGQKASVPGWGWHNISSLLLSFPQQVAQASHRGLL